MIDRVVLVNKHPFTVIGELHGTSCPKQPTLPDKAKETRTEDFPRENAFCAGGFGSARVQACGAPSSSVE